MYDAVRSPRHYKTFEERFGLEPKVFTRYMTFPAGNTAKYVARHEDKNSNVEDLEKALEYLSWAVADYKEFRIGPVIPSQADRMRLLVLRKLSGKVTGVYSSIPHLVYGNYDIAGHLINHELERIR